MKYTLLLISVFTSVVIYAGTDFITGIIGLTQLNGEGCLCHNLNADPAVLVWVEGPDTLEQNQTAQYRIRMTGGPAVKGGFNIAARFSNLSVSDTGTQEIDNEIAHNTPRSFVNDTVSWNFSFTASNSVNWDTIYSVAQSVNNDGIPSSVDRWNFGPKFPVRIIPPVPVELTSFTANADGKNVRLSWTTGSEVNNKGFEVLRKASANDQESEWIAVGFVNGMGTTSQPQSYSFIDKNITSAKLSYKLKQIDFDGKYKFTNETEVSVMISEFKLHQNFPNPFNPSTNISWELTTPGFVKLKIYNSLGEQVATLLNEYQDAGLHSTSFEAAADLASGIYLCSIEILPSENSPVINLVNKMVLLR